MTSSPRRTLRLNAIALLSFALSASGALMAGEPAASPQAGKGALVIVGGALARDNDPVYEALLSRRLEGRPLCVVPLASGEPIKSAHSYVEDFTRLGGEEAAVAVDLTTKNAERARDEEWSKSFRACGGLFFTGGDQSRIVDGLRPGGIDTPAAREIRALFERGAPIGGSSAGAAMMSDPMIGAGDPEDALRRGVVDEDGKRGVWVREGMGFLERGLTDQHFLERGRLGRLLVALDAHPDEAIGLGVGEDTALLVEGDEGRVIGRSQVALVRLLGPASPATRVIRARLWLLGEGDRAPLYEGAPKPAPDKAPIAASDDERPRPPRRPFEEDALAAFLRESVRTETLGRVLIERRGYALAIERDEGYRAFGREGEESSLFAGPFLVELVRKESS